ncbi:hypothetical protein [Nocardia terpenica]|uniref:Uncharacterized protein n=1 Tax=Nocardia terpenica TaxID=455432 RepID=A0A0U1Z213_9NOCA|nr:hypothetical protein [Nocardia terpenica]AJO72709.1 hypothetical protein [Nocardia terpenica]KZM75334.1 hypothetical protein AWN90_18245 [Nocardia terpenica]NQE85790.1 hypothetical protein [Nocardia terpenica]
MIHIRFGARSAVFAAGVVGCWGLGAVAAFAQAPASVSVQPELTYNVTTLTVAGSATCGGSGQAGVTVVDGSLEQMFPGGVGGPIAVRLDGPVMVDCDGAAHAWQGHLVAPGRALPNDSGGMLTVTLSQGPTVLATTGSQPIHIVS